MKNAINFVKLGVSTREFEETLTQIHHQNNMLMSYNGIVTMAHPVDSSQFGNIDFSVSSTKLIQAIAACNYAPDVKITDTNIIIKKGNFRSQLPYSSESLSMKPVNGSSCKITEKTILSIQKIYPFISDDASRSWSRGILIKKGKAYATNNIIVARVDMDLFDCFLPIELLAMLLKIKDATPKKLFVRDHAVRAKYENKAWIQCSTKKVEWPNVMSFFPKKKKVSKIPAIPDTFREAVEAVHPFVVEDALKIEDDVLTCDTTTVKKIGINDCSLSCANTRKMLETFTHCDFSKDRMPIKGDGIVGVMCQMVNI